MQPKLQQTCPHPLHPMQIAGGLGKVSMFLQPCSCAADNDLKWLFPATACVPKDHSRRGRGQGSSASCLFPRSGNACSGEQVWGFAPFSFLFWVAVGAPWGGTSHHSALQGPAPAVPGPAEKYLFQDLSHVFTGPYMRLWVLTLKCFCVGQHLPCGDTPRVLLLQSYMWECGLRHWSMARGRFPPCPTQHISALQALQPHAWSKTPPPWPEAQLLKTIDPLWVCCLGSMTTSRECICSRDCICMCRFQLVGFKTAWSQVSVAWNYW